MTSVWTAPGRVNLIGEHTDYNDGFVLPLALPLGVTARVTRRDDDLLRVTSSGFPDAVEVELSQLRPGVVEQWAAYVAGVVWALRRAGCELGGADVALDSDLPVGAGLSSSAAVECAAAGALADVYGCELSKSELVRLCHQAENDFVGVPSGVLDQSASVLCRAGHVLFLDARSLQARQVPLPLVEQELTILVIDTRAAHRLADGEYAKRRAECERAAARLGVASLRDVTDLDDALAQLDDDEMLRRRARHVLTENARVEHTVEMLESGADVRTIGALLTESHVSLRDDFEVSCAELDLAVRASLAAGAHGARMTGGGFGGSSIALVERASADEIGRVVAAAFEDAGLREPRVFAAVASDGAHPVAQAA
ncbi:MAG: galactokinase [Actinomycetota bacterium]|nr:galactokinase [Actinomycetota bacterium]